MEQGQDIVIRSSSLPRIMVCNGSLSLNTPPQEDSDVAKEGTAFHELVESIHKGLLVSETAKNGVIFDGDMYHYANKVLPLIPLDAQCETEIEFPVVEGIKVKGHLDYCWEEDGGDTLVVMDIKYGHRIVEIKDNWQLISYGIGELVKRQRQYNKIILRVIQPRPHHWNGFVRDEVLTTEKMFEYYQFMQETLQVYKEGIIRFNTSDKCRYCPALQQECPAINKAFFNAVDVSLNDKVQDNLTDDEISNMLKLYDRVKDIFKVKIDAIQDLAKKRLKEGASIKGYSLQPTFSNRKWVGSLDAEAFKIMSTFDLREKTLMSPAQAEKKGVPKELVASFTETVQTGFKLAEVDETLLANKLFNNN